MDLQTMTTQNEMNNKTEAFLRELTELSRKHGVGLAGKSELFLMEGGPGSDYERTYTANEQSELVFA